MSRPRLAKASCGSLRERCRYGAIRQQGPWPVGNLLISEVASHTRPFARKNGESYGHLFSLEQPSGFYTSLFFVAMTATLLSRHRKDARHIPDIASWIVTFIVIATVLATVFGVTPLFYPQFTHLLGFKVTDLFLYRQAGAATLGYAVMGMFEVRSRNWREVRGPIVMAAVFNGLSFLASLLAIVLGESLLLPVLVAIASLGVTVAAFVALRTRGGAFTETLATPSVRP